MIFLLMILNIFQMNQAELEIKDAWIRPAGEGMNSALYFTIENKSDSTDKFLSASCEFAEIVEIHETYHKENDMMGMRAVENVEVEANSTVKLKPGSFHVMIIKLKEDLKVGSKHKVKLKFEKAGVMEIEAEVKMHKMKMKMMHDH